jgi:hypothetical protein
MVKGIRCGLNRTHAVRGAITSHLLKSVGKIAISVN